MPDRTGRQIGNYRLVKLLGAGGFAEVYLGQHVHIHKQAAIKFLHAQLGQNYQKEFQQEAEIIASLKHPHIIRLIDYGIDRENAPYLIMDYAPQGTLRHRHPRGSVLPLATVVEYVKQIAQALQYAHDQRHIHRDVKPENMLIGPNNEILLSDFGLAVVAHSTHSQRTEEAIGTALYMAPEQWQGKPLLATDQYALGIICYEWFCGECPFGGNTLQLMYQHTQHPPSPLREKNPAISPAVEAVIMKALAKNYHERFASMTAFAEAFEEACRTSISSTFVKGQPLPDQRQHSVVKEMPPVQPSHRSQKGDLDIRQSSQRSDMRTPRITQDVNVSSQPSSPDVTSGRRTEQPPLQPPAGTRQTQTDTSGSSRSRSKDLQTEAEEILTRAKSEQGAPQEWVVFPLLRRKTIRPILLGIGVIIFFIYWASIFLTFPTYYYSPSLIPVLIGTCAWSLLLFGYAFFVAFRGAKRLICAKDYLIVVTLKHFVLQEGKKVTIVPLKHVRSVATAANKRGKKPKNDRQILFLSFVDTRVGKKVTLYTPYGDYGDLRVIASVLEERATAAQR